MGIADVNRAFAKGLGAKARCNGTGIMTWKTDDQGRRTLNQLTFEVTKPDGSKVTVTDAFPASSDPVAKALAMGETFNGS